jgi:glutamyl-tRNA reductase
MGQVDPAARERLQTMSRSIVSPLLREPTVRLERTVHEERGDPCVAAVRGLVGH